MENVFKIKVSVSFSFHWEYYHVSFILKQTVTKSVKDCGKKSLSLFRDYRKKFFTIN